MAVTAILLSAGYGTRLYPLTKDQPKALLPLHDGVILDEVWRSLEGIPDLQRRILVTNHRFAGHFQRWQRARGVDLEILDDGTDTPETRLGAIRDLQLAQTQGRAVGDLLVVGTDNLFADALVEFVKPAQRYRPDASIALGQARSKEAASQSGVVECNADSRITSFVEKSPNPPSLKIAHCLYYFPEAMLGSIQSFLDEGGNPDAPWYFLEWLVRTQPVYGILMGGMWYDIGSHEAYQAVVHEWRRKAGSAVRDPKP